MKSQLKDDNALIEKQILGNLVDHVEKRSHGKENRREELRLLFSCSNASLTSRAAGMGNQESRKVHCRLLCVC